MALNSEKILKKRQNLPTKEEMLSGKNTDNVLGSIQDPQTGEKAPASLTEGEYVIDVPAIIGLGEGDYNKGLDKLKRVHQMLQERGMQFMQQQQGNSGRGNK